MVAWLRKILNSNAKEKRHKFTDAEARNVLFYALGIMLYKFGLETFLGSIAVTAADGFSAGSAFALLGALQGANQAAQAVGSIIVSPLVARSPTSRVLASSVLGLALMSLVLIITEASTGGTLTTKGAPRPLLRAHSCSFLQSRVE